MKQVKHIKQVVHVKQVVERSLIDYTNAVIAAVSEGYEVDASQGRHPDFIIGLFMANFVMYKDTPDVVSVQAEESVEVKPKRAYNKADKAKAELVAKLGEDTNSIR